ncbi:MAG TPA: isomerase [Cytophagales bacterium]|nr:isomerase [Cytophagales bacterium]
MYQTLPLFQVDAFTGDTFGGNPACVVPLTEWLPDPVLLKIAQENAVAETAFIVRQGDGYHLRWFTPELEMDLCGHATLATAHVLRIHLGHSSYPIQFQTASGPLAVEHRDGWYHLDFPSRMPEPAELPAIIWQSLSQPPKAILKARDYVLVYDSEADIRNITIDRHSFDQINLDPGGVVVTAPGQEADFVSRFFTPQASILEDPVTGSAHCSLIPYWAKELGKATLTALQLSDRVGRLQCEDRGERVQISGQAVTYLKGEIYLT